MQPIVDKLRGKPIRAITKVKPYNMCVTQLLLLQQ